MLPQTGLDFSFASTCSIPDSHFTYTACSIRVQRSAEDNHSNLIETSKCNTTGSFLEPSQLTERDFLPEKKITS